MSGEILYCPAPTDGMFRKTMHFQVAIPESCSGDLAKVNNFRKHIAELNAELKDVDRIAARFELASKSKVVAAIIMESSISFLDLAASFFKPINPAAAKAASQGISVIRTTKDTGDYMTGQINGAQYTVALTNTALDQASDLSMFKSSTAKVVLGQAQTQMAVIGIAVEQASGASKEEMTQLVKDFSVDRGKKTITTIATAAEMEKTVAVIQVFGFFEGIYSAAIDYNKALEKHFDERIEDKLWVANFKQSQKTMLRNVISNTEKALRRAEISLDACISQNTEQRMSPFPGT